MSTHQELFASACQVTDFETDKKVSTGYDVWAVRYVRNGRHVDVDGPYFTEQEATVSAELLRGTFRGARAYFACHHPTWNPDPAREVLIRDQARTSRASLAIRLGVQHTTRELENS